MTFQAKLTTKSEQFSVEDPVLELRNRVDREELNEIVVTFLKKLERYDDKRLGHRCFDFLIGGKLLRLNVEEHLKLYSDELEANEVLNEKLVEVEYFLSLEPPKPLEALPHDDWVSCVDANESYIISGSYDNSIRIYSASDRKNLLTLTDAHEKPITRIKILNNKGKAAGKSEELYFISCGHDEVSIMRRLNKKTLKVDVVFVYKGHSRSVNCLDTVDDMIATGSFDKTLRLWSIDENLIDEGTTDSLSAAGGDELADNQKNKKQKTKSSEKSVAKTNRKAIMTLTGHHESVTGVRWLGSCNEFNSLASCSMDRSICIWDIELGECKRRILSAKPLLGIDFCAERNLIISGSCDRFVRLWDARASDNAAAKAAFTSHTAWVSSVAFGKASTNHFISGGYDNVVKLWDIRSSKACLYDLIGHHNKVLDVNWSNPTFVLSGSADSTLKIFSTK